MHYYMRTFIHFLFFLFNRQSYIMSLLNWFSILAELHPVGGGSNSAIWLDTWTTFLWLKYICCIELLWNCTNDWDIVWIAQRVKYSTQCRPRKMTMWQKYIICKLSLNQIIRKIFCMIVVWYFRIQFFLVSQNYETVWHWWFYNYLVENSVDSLIKNVVAFQIFAMKVQQT